MRTFLLWLFLIFTVAGPVCSKNISSAALTQNFLIKTPKSKTDSGKIKVPVDSLNGIYIPKDLAECITQLNLILSDSAKDEIKQLQKNDETYRMHFGLGLWIRNNWGLWAGSRLLNYFTLKEIHHPDNMSSIILDEYVRHLSDTNYKVKTFLLNDFRKDTLKVNIYFNEQELVSNGKVTKTRTSGLRLINRPEGKFIKRDAADSITRLSLVYRKDTFHIDFKNFAYKLPNEIEIDMTPYKINCPTCSLRLKWKFKLKNTFCRIGIFSNINEDWGGVHSASCCTVNFQNCKTGLTDLDCIQNRIIGPL